MRYACFATHNPVQHGKDACALYAGVHALDIAPPHRLHTNGALVMQQLWTVGARELTRMHVRPQENCWSFVHYNICPPASKKALRLSNASYPSSVREYA